MYKWVMEISNLCQKKKVPGHEVSQDTGHWRWLNLFFLGFLRSCNENCLLSGSYHLIGLAAAPCRLITTQPFLHLRSKIPAIRRKPPRNCPDCLWVNGSICLIKIRQCFVCILSNRILNLTGTLFNLSYFHPQEVFPDVRLMYCGRMHAECNKAWCIILFSLICLWLLILFYLIAKLCGSKKMLIILILFMITLTAAGTLMIFIMGPTITAVFLQADCILQLFSVHYGWMYWFVLSSRRH